MQSEFYPLVEVATQRCLNHFCNRLTTVYLHGSINTNDAIVGVSDLDYHLVIADDLHQSDIDWITSTEAELQQLFPVVNGVHLACHTIDDLQQDKFSRFVLRYNASVHYGSDIVRQLEDNGCERFEPNKRMAKERLNFARKCFEDARAGKQPACTGEIPENTCYAARKFARYFVIIEGAYFLMAKDQFRSFRKEDVISQLKVNCAEFDEILCMANLVLQDPVASGITHSSFLEKAAPLIEWMFDYISNA